MAKVNKAIYPPGKKYVMGQFYFCKVELPNSVDWLTGNLATRDAIAYKYLTNDQAEDRRAACLIVKQKQQNVSWLITQA